MLRGFRPLAAVVLAGAGFFWLAIMLWLALADYVTRVRFSRPW